MTPPFPPGTFAPRPGAGSRPAMLAAQAGTELRLALRHGEQALLTLLIPAVLLVGLTLVDVVALPEPRVAHVVPSVLTWNEAAVNESWLGYLGPLSLFDRTATFAEGAIDTRDLVYFALFTTTCLACTLLALESRRWRGVR